MKILPSACLASLLFLLGSFEASAQNTNAPTPSTQVWVRQTVLGISEGVQFGTTVNQVGNVVGFTSSNNIGNTDTLYTIFNNNTPNPQLWMTNGDFQANTNFPSFPTNRARFTEITGYSQGIMVGNCTVTNGVTAFLISNNPSQSLISYNFPAAKPHSTLFTGLCNGVAVGNYTDMSNAPHGFWYNLTNGSYAALDVPAGIGRTHINGISEGVIYGSFSPASNNLVRGFIYSKSGFGAVRYPGSSFSEVTGYSQGLVAGNFVDTNGLWHGFYWSSGTSTNYDYPNSSYTHFASYNNGMIMGNYLDTNGFMQNFSSSNVVTRAILITTNVWTVPFSSYPLHANGPHPTLYVAPAGSTYVPPPTGVTSINIAGNNWQNPTGGALIILINTNSYNRVAVGTYQLLTNASSTNSFSQVALTGSWTGAFTNNSGVWSYTGTNNIIDWNFFTLTNSVATNSTSTNATK
jgi:hypothetical protein